MRVSIFLTCLAVCGVLAGVVSGQDTAPAFEVVSVKPNDSGSSNSSSMVTPGARYVATNATLRMMIKTAYQVHDDQIVGGPGWVSTDRFDLNAKGEGSPTPTAFITQARLMLRPALAARFNLSLHTERREIPVYALVPARRDGSFGRQLRRSNDCGGAATPLPIASDATEPIPDLPCGSGFSRAGHVSGRDAEFATLFRALSTWTDRVLIDRTGLTGRFDWDLQWTPEALTPDIAIAPNRLPLVTAMQEQLGFKLDAQRDLVEVLIIDRAERPQPD